MSQWYTTTILSPLAQQALSYIVGACPCGRPWVGRWHCNDVNSTPVGVPLRPIHFKYETISLCHPERSEGSLAGQRADPKLALRMTVLYLAVALAIIHKPCYTGSY